MVTQVCNLGPQEVEVGGSGVQGQLQLHSEFEVSLAYLKTLSQKTKLRAVMYIFNLSTQEVQTGRGQPSLQSGTLSPTEQSRNPK